MSNFLKKNDNKPPAAQLRQSQILSTYGPGSMVDLPECSVLILGLNHWSEKGELILEERLAAKVSRILGVPNIKLYTPPTGRENHGIKALMFPQCFLGQIDQTWEDGKTKKIYRTRPLLSFGDLVRGKYITEDGKKVPVVPVRFVQGCVKGHISDIDWGFFVHQDVNNKCSGSLWLDEGGSGNDFAEIYVRCEGCDRRRPLANATLKDGRVLGPCKGDSPWLDYSRSKDSKNSVRELTCMRESSNKPEYNYNRLLVRSASNAYFSQVLSVISLPDVNEPLQGAVHSVYDDLKKIKNISAFKIIRENIEKVSNALEGFSDEAVWEEIQRRQQAETGPKPELKSIKQTEIETLLSSPEGVGEDVPQSDFYATARNLDGLSPRLSTLIDRIVLVHRLREVIAQIGFTRFEPEMLDIDGELDINVRRAALDVEYTWVPAIENRGEGVLIAFSKDAIDKWLEKEPVKKRGRELLRGFDSWCARRGLDQEKKEKNVSFPGLPYIMLHSLSHLLIMTVSLECGYAASSIRERIYANEGGYGILLYTSSNSEGTLGGLIEVGKRIEYHLELALEQGKLCSNDPVCAQHRADDDKEERFLHGAACHGCLLIAESSCERRNEFLDRALVVGTLENLGAEFFTG